jgi:hypothetical protein
MGSGATWTGCSGVGSAVEPVRWQVNTGVSAIRPGSSEDNIMRYCEIAARVAAPDTHRYVADISLDPTEFSTFERLMEDRPEVRLLARVDRPDVWVVHVACANAAVRERLHDAWG